ncbi:MAG: hypothetical protein SVR04_03205 [Spirochaetota bacterium]|nr:hypothetical protein [Spirochaetota bacterium]
MLTQEEWETNIEFEQRVAEAQQARQKIIDDLQENTKSLLKGATGKLKG